MKKKSDFERLVIINDRLLTWVETELNKETAPSKEILDTIQTIAPIIIAIHKVCNEEQEVRVCG